MKRQFWIRRYLKGIAAYPRLTPERELELTAQLMRRDDDAIRQELALSSLYQVVQIAASSAGGVPLEDRIGEGNLGLVMAARRFDPKMRYRFSAYAAWRIEHAIHRAIRRQGALVRVPDSMIKKWMLATASMRRSGRLLSENEMSDHLSISIDTARTVQVAVRGGAPKIGPAEAITKLADNGLLGPAQIATNRDEIRVACELLGKIDRVKANVLRLHFGLEGSPQQTPQEIAATMGVSVERIRLLEQSALRELIWLAKGAGPV